MDIRLLREFLVLTVELNFSRAAERMNMTQPALSRHMKHVEEVVGAVLVDRSTRKIVLTAAGEVFSVEVQKILAQLDGAIVAARAVAEQQRHTISIAFLGEAARPFLSQFLGEFQMRHTDYTISLAEGEHAAVSGFLERRDHDLSVLIRPQGRPLEAPFRRTTVRSEPLCIAVNKRHRLAGRGPVSIREIADWPLAGTTRQASPLAWDCNSWFLARHGLDYDPARTGANIRTCLFGLEIDDRSIVLLPHHWGHLLGENVVLAEIIEADCRFDVDLVWDPTAPKPAVATFLSEFEGFLRAPAAAQRRRVAS